MFTDQCVSVTDLKKDMNSMLKNLRKDKIIFVNNTPVAVLMDVRKYEQMIKDWDFLNSSIEPIRQTRKGSKKKK